MGGNRIPEPAAPTRAAYALQPCSAAAGWPSVAMLEKLARRATPAAWLALQAASRQCTRDALEGVTVNGQVVARKAAHCGSQERGGAVLTLERKKE